jgi:thiol-disulfide isomerase/thioredoxin
MKYRLNRIAALLAVLACLSITGCGQRPATVAAAPPAHADATLIDWFKGNVDAAFAAAAQQHKPVLLYWGAEWCPPCQQLKATVFQRADFVAKTRLFVPVYLDGDEPGAQKWGEQFRVTGYPTMLVLSPKRVETMRIAGGMDLTQYASILDLSLSQLLPVEQVLSAATSRALTSNECQRLALNAWILDDTTALQDTKLSGQLLRAAGQCPVASVAERGRLMIVAAFYASNSEADTLAAGKTPSAALTRQVVAVSQLLASDQLAASNNDVLTYLGEPFFLAVKAQGTASAAKFNAMFAAVMEKAANNPQFAAADQLSAVANRLHAEQVLMGTIGPTLARYSRERLDAALATPAIPYVRSGLINAALPIFELLGANAEAYELLQGELSKTQTPYYYQADLAALAEDLGRNDEAVLWAQKAYDGAQGAATRFQWGIIYMGSLLRLQPKETARIQATGLAVLGELDGSDRIYQRARTRLERLDGLLRKWQSADQTARRPVLLALRTRMNQTCATIPAAEPARRSCEEFLKTGL